jgi:ABC-type dipeptide/oligopeptide/nickel transport system permease subunit
MTRAPWLMLAPGLAITLVVGALNLMGNGLNREVS